MPERGKRVEFIGYGSRKESEMDLIIKDRQKELRENLLESTLYVKGH